MENKELADRIVALGVGLRGYWIGGHSKQVSPNKFVSDWRVAGAMIEAKCWGVNTVRKGDEWEAHVVPIGQIREYKARNKSPVRAILEACCEALDE